MKQNPGNRKQEVMKKFGFLSKAKMLWLNRKEFISKGFGEEHMGKKNLLD
jgi:hypothetical protein